MGLLYLHYHMAARIGTVQPAARAGITVAVIVGIYIYIHIICPEVIGLK
jgi:hypothetical protein